MNAQMQLYSKSATIPEAAYNLNPLPAPPYFGVENTGNDIINKNISATNYELSATVWDGNDPSMGWMYKVNGVVQSNYIIRLGLDVVDPDIALIQRDNANLKWYALVCYKSSINDNAYLKIYDFNPVTFVWTLIKTVSISNGDVITAINIDTDQDSHFFIVWDQLNGSNNQTIYCAAGAYMPNKGYPDVCMLNYELTGGFAPNTTLKDDLGNDLKFPYSEPDVSVYDYPTTPQYPDGGDLVIVCKTGGSAQNSTWKGTIDCWISRFSDWQNCSFIPPNLWSLHTVPFVANEELDWPRIGRHRYIKNNSSGYQTGFTFVYEKHNTFLATNDVCGFTFFYQTGNNASILTDNNYTNGSAEFWLPNLIPSGFFLPNISQYQNSKPVISYERISGSMNPNAQQNMIISFNHNDVNGAQYPLAFYAQNATGRPYTNKGFYKYYEVPILPGTESVVSVSGEQSGKFLSSFFDADDQQIQYKTVQSKAHLKTTSLTSSVNEPYIQTILLSDYAVNMELLKLTHTISLTDNLGRQVSISVNQLNELNNICKASVQYLTGFDAENNFCKFKLLKL